MSLASHQHRRNCRQRDSWSRYAAHRDRVTSLLVSARPPSTGNVAILGAGNCNDLDLNKLGATFRTVNLIDIDRTAVEYGIRQQSFIESAQLNVIAPYDVTGWFVAGNSPQESADFRRRPPDPPIQLGPADVAASVCLLSQIVEAAVQIRPRDSSSDSQWALASRDQHLEYLISMLPVGGLGIVVTDFTSSDTCPELLMMSDTEVAAKSREWLQSGNHFTGINPVALANGLRDGKWGPIHADRVLLLKPWKWSISERKAFAVTALCFEKR